MATWVGATSNYNSSSNWTGDTPDAPGETATFDMAGSTTVTVNSAVNPDSWIFNASAKSFAIGGAAVTLNTGLVNNSAVAQSIANVIAGTGGLQQNGSGTLTLNGKNTYTGATHIDVGTLRMGTSNAISTASAVTVASGATFDLSGSIQMVGSLAGAGNVTLGFGRLYTGNDNTNTTFSGIISGTNGINKEGAGTLILSGQNTYSSNTFIDGGTLQLGVNNGLPFNGSLVQGLLGPGTVFDLTGFNQTLAVAAGPGSIKLGSGTLTINNTFFTSIESPISGTGSFIKQGSAELEFSANNTYTGTTTISDGVLRLGFLNSTGGSVVGNIVNNAVLDVSRSNTLVLGGTISGSGTFRQDGTGTTVLSSANTYDGNTFLNGGTLDLAAVGAAGHGTIIFGVGSQTLRIEVRHSPAANSATRLTRSAPAM